MAVSVEHNARTDQQSATSRRTQAIVVSHTHWDREWYLSQKQFQFLLGDTLDAIIDALEHEPGFKCFMADGQTSMIQDYLEIRPNQRAHLLRLVQQQRLIVGPWYTMPDLWLPSGESLIRNLLRGRLDCERLGAKWQPAGYVPDSFGHIEQMPQILNGFGINTYFFARGKAETSLPDEMAFMWVGPDHRSKVTAHRLPAGYGNATMLPSAGSDALKYRLETILRPYRSSAGDHGPSLLLNGFDHIWVQRDLPAIVERAAEIMPDVEFVIGTLQTFIAAYEEYVDVTNLPPRRGCLRDTKLSAGHLHGTWSSRIDNKLENAAAAAVLEGLAEPASAMLIVAGGPNRRSDLGLAWQAVLQNHAHDSICGCSTDAVHADVSARFRHAEELSEMIAADALRKLIGEPAHPTLVRLSGLGGASAWCELLVDTPDDQPVRISGPDGEIYPMQTLSKRRLRRHDCLITETGAYDTDGGIAKFTEHRLLAQLPEAAPLELQRFKVSQSAESAPLPPDVVRISETSLENQFIRVEILSNGLLRLHHKPTGQVYDRLLELIDDADAGGGYIFKPIAADVAERSSAANVHINTIEQGPIRGTLCISIQWPLPASLNENKNARVDDRIVCDGQFQISLASNEDQLSCKLRFTNRAIEHRVRLNIPLPFHTDRVEAERSFIVVDEDLTRFTAEPGQHTHPMRNWVAASADGAGLAFVGRGLHEYAVEDAGGTSDLRITILRSVPFVDVCGTWRTPEAEMRRTLEYEFAIIPFAKDWRRAGIAERAHRFVHRSAAEVVGDRRASWDHLPHATVRIEEQRGSAWIPTASHRSAWRKHFGDRDGWRRQERMPHYRAATQLISIEGDQVLLSCVKPAERASEGGDDSSTDVIVRFYSLAEHGQVATLNFGFSVIDAWECDLAETNVKPLPIMGSRAQLTISPFEVKTIRLKPAKP